MYPFLRYDTEVTPFKVAENTLLSKYGTYDKIEKIGLGAGEDWPINVDSKDYIRVDEDDTLNIDFHIIVAYGVNIKTVVSNLVSTVKYQIEDYTNMKVKNIKVFVEGVRVID
jgi:uncharacterized alkaline shock family protein YloU